MTLAMTVKDPSNGTHDATSHVVPLWINGEATTSTPVVTFAVQSMSTSEAVHHAHSANTQAAERAVEAAAAAFVSWRKTSPQSRRDLLLRVADKYEALTPALIDSQMLETSCTEAWARGNIQYAAEIIRESASRITSVSGDIPQTQGPDRLALVFKQPIGPVLTIAP